MSDPGTAVKPGVGQQKAAGHTRRSVLVDQAEWNVFFITPHIMASGVVVFPGFSAPRVVPNVDGRLAIHA